MNIFMVLILVLSLEFSILENPELTEKDIQTIKKGIFTDSYMLSQNALFYNQTHFKDKGEKNINRMLDENQITLKDVGFFSYDLGTPTKSIWSYYNIFSNIDKDRSKYILYPYSFKYEIPPDESGIIQEKEQDKGGFFSLSPNLLPSKSFSRYFENLKNISSVEISKSKALYDIDIGILSYETTLNGNPINLFSEADLFCSFFAQRIAKVSDCARDLSQLSSLRQEKPNKGAVLLISPDILKDEKFSFKKEENKFGILIIPDHVFQTEDIIINAWGTKGINKIKEFIEGGGNILATGKSGYILEKLGIISNGLYKTDKYLYYFNNDRANEKSQVSLTGCEDIPSKTPTEQSDYFKQVMCMNINNKIYLTSAYTMDQAKMEEKGELSTIMSIKSDDIGDYLKYKLENGDDQQLGEDNYFPIVLTKQDGQKGRITIINGNLLVNTDNTFQLIMDPLFYSMGKNVIFDAYIKYSEGMEEDIPIPGGEEGIRLNCYFKFLNLFEMPINEITVDIFTALKTEFVSTPEGCQKIQNDKTKYINITDMDMTYYMHCNLDELQKYSEFSKEIIIEITDQSVTQRASYFSLFHPFLEYKDSGNNEKVEIDHGAVVANAALSAILRVTANSEPPGDYPLWGRGCFFHQVFNVENKEDTIAKNVKLISIIPIISLIVEDVEKNAVVHTIEFYDKYYKKHNYTYPFTETGAEVDYIDYAELSGKDIVIDKDYDQPIKQYKVERSDLKESGEVQNLFEVNGTLNIDIEENALLKSNNQILLKQVCYKDADIFYEIADFRRFAFIDTSEPNGAKEFYNNNIPDEEKDPADPSRAKINVLFSRVDFYFKNDPNYQIPKNIDDKMIISCDKYEFEPEIFTDKEIGEYSANKSKIGSMDSKVNDGKIIPDEFYNVLKQHEQINKIIDPLETGYNITEDYPDMKLSHYLVRIKGDRISRAGSIKGFIEEETESNYKPGYLEEYPSVKFIFAHSVSFIIGKNLTRLGGKLVIDLGIYEFKDDKQPSENEFVTMSVDGVAVYKIEYDYQKGVKNKIIAYFKRGLMPDEISGKDSTVELNIENIASTENISAKIELYELKYDLTKKEKNFEDYVKVESFITDYIISYHKFWSLPCLIIENKFERNESDIIQPYELLDPFARYTLYYQELLAHREVYANSLSAHFTTPGLQTPFGSYRLISNIGIVSIPFADYVSHPPLMIPSAPSTSRIEWQDIWGRNWAQPIRSIFPDFLPLPYVSQNFMMSTTYEIIQDGNRVLEWSSADSAYIFVHIKFLNNYFKYVNLAICKENSEISGNSETDNVTISNSKVYGTCYQNPNAFLSGRKIDNSIIEQMNEAMLCPNSDNALEMLRCTQKIKSLNLPLLTKRDDKVKLDEGYRWNYSPLVESYYPNGYLDEEIMWEMTKYNYASDVYFKGYPWHFDNNLPGFDGKDIIDDKPVNLMAFPIFKGFGYKIEYSPNNTVPNRYNNGKGWWSDNLQNKDNTLLAGQPYVNKFPTINKTLLSDDNWINGKKINSIKIQQRLKNKYICQFNQHRIKVNPKTSTKFVSFKNIYQNNIIPIYPDNKDTDYTDFDCTNEYQYSPSNISLADNRVKTNNDRDWLYFALNLRAEAKETLNIILTLDPFSDTQYEGEAKIQDGGRFTYWNPALTRTGYIYLDNNVNVVRAYRVNLTCDVTVYPSNLNTFKAVNYHLFTLEDKNEYLREYKTPIYTNSYGFGDSVVTIYVGGTENSDCKLKPGQTTFVKITFYNNAGFDWNLKAGAITANGLNIAPNQLMKEKVHSVRIPKEYKFLELDIPEPIKNYIEIVPSDHNQNVSAQFFDFEGINVVTIRDGFKGEYYYKLTLKEGLDEKYFGRFWEIKVNINYDYFDILPGLSNDPVTKVNSGITMKHDYTLKVPSIKFGIPYSSNYKIPEYRNKVFYTIGRSSNLSISYNIYEEFSLDDIKILSLEEVDKLMEASASESNANEKLLDIWNNTIANKSSYLTGEINANVLDAVDGYKRIWIYLNKSFPEFPYEVYGEPDITKIFILVKISAPQVAYGSRLILKWGYGQYNDSRVIRKTNTGLARNINAYGPWIKMDIENILLNYDKEANNFTEKDNQTYFGYNGYMKLKITAINSGSKDAYQTSYKYIFSKYVEIIDNFGDLLDKKDIVNLVKNESSGETIVSFNSNRQIPQNTKDSYYIYLKYDFGDEIIDSIIVNRNLDDETNNEKVILKSADVTLCQNVECNEDNSFVNQFININFKMPLAKLKEEEEKRKEILDNKPIFQDKDKDEEEEDKNHETKSKSKAWLIALIIAALIVIGLIIYLVLDFKKKLFIFKNRPEYVSDIEEIEKKENPEKVENTDTINTVNSVRRHSIKNRRTNSTFFQKTN